MTVPASPRHGGRRQAHAQGRVHGVFALTGYTDTVRAVSTPTRTVEGLDLAGFRSRVFRFPGSVPDLRLPKDVSALGALLGGPSADAGVAWTVLQAPHGRVPMLPVDGCRRAALLGAVGAEPGGMVLGRVLLTVRPAATRYAQPELVSAALDVAGDRDAMVELLLSTWLDAEPSARTGAAGAPALWLGGSPAEHGAGFVPSVQATGAVFGLDVEVAADVTRRVREIGTRTAGDPPQYLLVWVPYARGTEPVVGAYRRATAEGEVVELHEPSLDDALLDLRWALDELGLADAPPTKWPDAARTPPVASEERFYIKGTGSAVGDLMIDVTDCGHGHWGSDCRRIAPRAWKGIGYLETVMPKALFRCEKCSKHRWRARW